VNCPVSLTVCAIEIGTRTTLLQRQQYVVYNTTYPAIDGRLAAMSRNAYEPRALKPIKISDALFRAMLISPIKRALISQVARPTDAISFRDSLKAQFKYYIHWK